MTIDLLIEIAWKSALCAGSVLLLLRVLRSRSAAEKSAIAYWGLLALLLLPFAVAGLPELEISAPAQVSSAFTDPGGQTAAPVELPAPEPGTAGMASRQEANWPQIALLLYALPALLLLLGLAASLWRLQRIRARADLLVNPLWLTALAGAQRRTGFKHGTALLTSAEVSSPVSWGILRPVIIIDPAAASDAARAEAVIAHELAHVVRLDWLKLIMGRLAIALFWFNPLVWLLARQSHHLCEESADDAVLRADINSADYAELLVSVARHENRGMLLAANGVAPRRGSLDRRIMRVLDPSHSRVAPRLVWTFACCAGALLVNAPLSALTLVEKQSAQVLQVATGASPERPVRSVASLPLAAAPTAAGKRQDQRALRSAGLFIHAEALIEAARRGNLAAMAELIEAGASPDSVLDGDGTPLIAAAEAGRGDAVAFLLARGADFNLAVRGDGNPLIAAAGAGRTDIVRMLLDRGADIEAAVPGDENALITASRHGRTEVVRVLVARGADVNRSLNARTPLAMAQAGGHAEIVTLLREAGATR